MTKKVFQTGLWSLKEAGIKQNEVVQHTGYIIENVRFGVFGAESILETKPKISQPLL